MRGWPRYSLCSRRGIPPSPLGGLLLCKPIKRKRLDAKYGHIPGVILACKRLFPLGLGGEIPPRKRLVLPGQRADGDLGVLALVLL